MRRDESRSRRTIVRTATGLSGEAEQQAVEQTPPPNNGGRGGVKGEHEERYKIYGTRRRGRTQHNRGVELHIELRNETS
jgi:hypothetical protein